MYTVLHLTTHMGGGVGKTLSNVAVHAKENGSMYQHVIACLEQPEKRQYIDYALANNISVYVTPEKAELIHLILSADIVQLEWWHHPLMAAWLNSTELPEMRLIIWCHVSGYYPPVIPPKLLDLPNFFMFTTPYSYEIPSLRDVNWNNMHRKTAVVFGSGGFGKFSTITPIKHFGYNVGYVGTFDFCKLHPSFINFCAQAGIKDARFIMVGDASTQSILEAAAKTQGILDQFEFTGYTDDVAKQLARFDVFGYPLNPEHFGASENTLLEAMAAGIPPVVLSQAAEKYIVKHQETGLLVNNIEEYGQALRYLYHYPEERKRLGNNARNYVINQYSIEQIVNKLDINYEKIMTENKARPSFKEIFGLSPGEWFLACLGSERTIFQQLVCNELPLEERKNFEVAVANCRQILKGKTKSSVNHFLSYYPTDKWLIYWADLIAGRKMNDR